MDKFEKEIRALLKDKIKTDIELTIPPDPLMGDYAFPCFALAKEKKKNPAEIAQEIAKSIEPTPLIRKIEVKGPYVNFFVDKKKLAEQTLKDIAKQKDSYGSTITKKEKIMVEYPSPNTNKPLHLGHVRNMLLGKSVATILSFQGKKVIQANMNNDRGVHICKSMLAYKKFGDNQQPNKKTDHFVGDYYVLYNQKEKEDPSLEEQTKEMLKKWEEGDKEVIALWKLMNRWALDGFNETYQRLGINFDKVYYESEYYDKGKDIVTNALKKGVFRKEDNNAIGVELKKYGLPDKVLLRADGTSIYMTQDLHLAVEKFKEFKLDKSIYVVGSEQNMHFKQLFKILELLGYKWAEKCYHLSYGMVYLPHGRMKSREGQTVDADELIDEMMLIAESEITKRHDDLSHTEIKKRSKQIGLGALRFFILKMDPAKDMTYNTEESISFEGETGPYVQYAHARISSILKKHGKLIKEKVDFSLLNTDQEEQIVKFLSQFPAVVLDAELHLKPSLIARYLSDLSQKFNEFYHAHQILNEKDELRDARLFLIICIQQVLKNGLALLNIEAPDQM
jgi:arginyl-tRNA synthetase